MESENNNNEIHISSSSKPNEDDQVHTPPQAHEDEALRLRQRLLDQEQDDIDNRNAMQILRLILQDYTRKTNDSESETQEQQNRRSRETTNTVIQATSLVVAFVGSAAALAATVILVMTSENMEWVLPAAICWGGFLLVLAILLWILKRRGDIDLCW